jgi:hypothetical protein
MKRSQLNVALAVAVAGLGALLWFSREQQEVFPPLTPLAREAITSISVAHPDQPLIKLRKQDAQWSLVEPVTAPVDDFEVASLLGLADTEVKRSLPVTEVDLAELKLDPPQYRITLNEIELGFGDSEPLEHRRYVRNGDQVALVADPPSAALDADYSDLVSKALVPATAEIRRIELPGLTVTRDDAGAWTSPEHADADAARIGTLVKTWQDLRAMWNAARPADAGDAGDPVRIVLADGELNLRIVEREPQLQIDNPAYGVRYTVSKAELDKLTTLVEPAPDPAAAADRPEAAAPPPM